MSLVAGSDYLLVEGVAYVGCAGTGKSCLVCTREFIVMIPVETQLITQRRLSTTSWKLDGLPPAQFIGNYALRQSTAIADFQEMLLSTPEKIPYSEIHNLSQLSRLKIRNGFLSRGIYFSREGSGAGWKGYSLRKTDAMLLQEFYSGNPKLVT